MVANFSQKSGLIPVTKDNPCPHCGKPDWCYSIGELSVCNRDQPPATGWEVTSRTDEDGHFYYAPIQEQKPIRPAANTCYYYPAQDGSPLVRVKRIDFGDGRKKKFEQNRWDKDNKCWLSGLGEEGDPAKVGRVSIPIYRYAEVQEAKARGELIALVDGEACADTLWDLGLAATTSIGGMGKWGDANTRDLEGAKIVVIVVDRDIPGIKDAAKVSEHFPEAQWLYPYPESKAWDNPPKSQGLDIKDWIEGQKLSAADVLAAIGEKKVLQVSIAKPGSGSNIITHARFASPNPAELRAQVRAIVDAGITGSERTAAINSLPGSPQQNWKLYEEISEEIEHEQGRLDRKADIENLLKIDKRRLTLENYLHPYLAEPIKKVATLMGVDAEAILTFLLPTAASLLNPSSCIVAKECMNFVQPPILYTAVVSPTGAKKTPILNVVKNPLVRLQTAEDARHEQASQQFEAEQQAFKETKRREQAGGEEPPQKPNPPREFYIDNATVEAVDKIKSQQPEHGLISIKDELSGHFASQGAYKKGKGEDKESNLSGWNGGGIKKNRAGDGSRVSLSRDSLSVTGGIQPDKLRAQFGDFTDAQGELARFLFYNMPMRPYKIPREDSRYDLGDLLEGIYKKIDSLPILKLRFDKQGQTYFDDYYDLKYEQTRIETNPGLRAALAKIAAQAVRLIGVLHVLHEVVSGAVEVPEEIPFARVKAGCQLAEFYLGQVILLQRDGDVLNGELTPVLKVLLEKVTERGSLTATEAKKTVWSLRKIEPNKIRQYFNELAAMDLAVVQGTGSRSTLTPKISTVDEHQQLLNPSTARIPEKSTPRELRIVDEVLMSHQQPENLIQQGIRDIKYQTVDDVDAISTAEINIQPSKVETDSDANNLLIDNPDICINTSTSSTVSSQILAQQECAAVDEISPPASTVDASTDSPPETAPEPPPLYTESALLIERVKAAKTWAECEAVWGDDLDLKEKIKSQLSQKEYRRIGKLAKQALIDSPATEPIALADNSQEPEPEPELAEPAQTAPAQSGFKVGDRVRIISKKSKYQGKCGEILHILPKLKRENHSVQLDREGHRKTADHTYLSASDIELVAGPEVTGDAE